MRHNEPGYQHPDQEYREVPKVEAAGAGVPARNECTGHTAADHQYSERMDGDRSPDGQRWNLNIGNHMIPNLPGLLI